MPGVYGGKSRPVSSGALQLRFKWNEPQQDETCSFFVWITFRSHVCSKNLHYCSVRAVYSRCAQKARFSAANMMKSEQMWYGSNYENNLWGNKVTWCSPDKIHLIAMSSNQNNMFVLVKSTQVYCLPLSKLSARIWFSRCALFIDLGALRAPHARCLPAKAR